MTIKELKKHIKGLDADAALVLRKYDSYGNPYEVPVEFADIQRVSVGLDGADESLVIQEDLNIPDNIPSHWRGIV
jgi:alanyl-tRNA synthetase